MVGGYAKFESEHLTAAAERIERGRDKSVIDLSRFVTFQKHKAPVVPRRALAFCWIEPTTNGSRVQRTRARVPRKPKNRKGGFARERNTAPRPNLMPTQKSTLLVASAAEVAVDDCLHKFDDRHELGLLPNMKK